MSTSVNSTHTSVPASSRTPSSIPANHTHPEFTNGHHHHHHDVGAQSGSAMGKKGKQKKATDPTEASNLIAAKISQLESDAAGDKEQEAEIGWLRRLNSCVCAVCERSAEHETVRSYSACPALPCCSYPSWIVGNLLAAI
jgi:hypothetical protein